MVFKNCNKTNPNAPLSISVFCEGSVLTLPRRRTATWTQTSLSASTGGKIESGWLKSGSNAELISRALDSVGVLPRLLACKRLALSGGLAGYWLS